MKIDLVKKSADGKTVYSVLIAETDLNSDEDVSSFNILYLRDGYEVRIDRSET